MASGSTRSGGGLEPRLHLVPRFRQLLYRPRLGLGWPLWVDAPSFDVRRRRQEVWRGWSGLAHPGRTMRQARRVLPAWWEVLAEKPAPRTSLNRPVGSDRQLAIIRGRLDHTKQIAHVHHAKVNDVVMAAVAGGLRELLATRGEDVEGLAQRAMAPIFLHEEQPGQAQGNKPGWMMVPLPVGEADPVRRLELIAAETAARKHSAARRPAPRSPTRTAAQRWRCSPSTTSRRERIDIQATVSPGRRRRGKE